MLIMGDLQFVDYIVFGTFFAICLLIGLYYGWRDRKSESKDDYFVGNRQMNVIAVGLSFFVSNFSSIGFLALPNDTYFRGPGIWIILWGILFSLAPLYLVFIPVFHRLKLTNIYDYLELRFNKAVKYIAVFVQVFFLLLYMSLSIYAPALAVTTFFKIDVPVAIAIVGSICVAYTAIGGVKAVVWTDVLQTIIVLFGFLLITVFAVREVGGFAIIWKVTSENDRQFKMDFRPSPAIPYTFWSALIAAPCLGLFRSVCCQHVAQRYLSVKTTRQALLTACIGQFLTFVTLFWLIFIGLVMFTFYAECDPFTLGVVQKFDQMVPYFIMDLFENIPGFVGILTAAIFSAAVSSVSSGINALSLISHKEVLYLVGKDLTPKQELIVAKILTGVIGVLTLLVTFLAPYLGGIMDALLTWQGIFLGPVLGAYVLGIFFPRVNTTSCVIGMILGLTLPVTLKIGNMLYPKNIAVLPPLSIDGCSATTEITVTQYVNVTSSLDERPSGLNFSIWQITTFYYGAISTYLTIIVGLMMSFISKPSDSTDIDERLVWHPTWPRCRKISANDEIDFEDDNDYHVEKSYKPVDAIDLQDYHRQSNA